MHICEGRLRAYLDEQVTPEERRRVDEHLCTCAKCRQRMQALASRRDRAAAALASLPTPQDAETVHPREALARFRQRFGIHERKEGRDTVMKKQDTLGRWKPVWIGLAVLLIVSLFIFYPPLRTAASDFLGVFRVRKFVAIPVNVAMLENPTFTSLLESAFSQYLTPIREPGPPIAVASADEAEKVMGFQVRLPATLPEGYSAQPRLTIQDGFAFRVQVDMDYVRAIREALGKTDVPIPAGLDGAVLEATVPKVLVANYASEQGMLGVVQAVSPEIQLPPNLDLQQIGEFGLRLAGIPAAQARAMAAAIDWANTLIIPVPLGYASHEEVSVAGTRGVLISENAPAGAGDRLLVGNRLLVFERDGIVYGLDGFMRAEELLAIAESMF